MLRCSQVLQLLADLVGQELPVKCREEVVEHLQGCECCAVYASSYLKVIDLGHRLPMVPFPPELWQQLRARARELGLLLPNEPGPFSSS